MSSSTKYKRLLIVEDEKKIASLLKDYLDNYFEQIDIISTGDKVLEHFEDNEPSFVLLDVMLPGVDGFELCKEIRKKHDVPIMFITAQTSEVNRVLGLEFGADDYVSKPFSVREVVARVKRIMERANASIKGSSPILEVNGVSLDINRHSVKIDGRQLKLTPTEFDILETLMRQPDFVFERGYLVSKVMGYEYEGYERNVDSHVKNLRRKISEATGKEKIQSIYGVGYKFIAKDNS